MLPRRFVPELNLRQKKPGRLESAETRDELAYVRLLSSPCGEFFCYAKCLVLRPPHHVCHKCVQREKGQKHKNGWNQHLRLNRFYFLPLYGLRRRKKMFRRTVLVFLLVLLSLTIVSSQNVTPPSQPQTGPGGMQSAHAGVTKNRYGRGGQEYWIFEPDSPKPRSAPVIVFLHGWGGMNPLYYGAWLDHLVKRGNIVIYPRYQQNLLTAISDFTPNTLYAVKNAIHRLKTEPGHVTADLSRFATVGHSLGGLLAANVAALASESNLPQVRAVMSVEPGITDAPISVPLAD